MKLFACSDFHGARIIMDKLPQAAEMADMVLLCGDICGRKFGQPTENLPAFQRESIDYVCGLLDAAGTPYRYIYGNDDWIETTLPARLIKPETVNGVTLLPMDLVLPFGKHTNREAPEEEIAARLEEFTCTQTTIVVAHTPPYGACDLAANGKRCGSTAAREWIERNQPLAWFCGHIHEDYSTDRIGRTRIFNCAVWLWETSLRGWLFDTDTGAYEKLLIP